MFEGKLTKNDGKGKVSYHRNIISSIVMLATSEIPEVVMPIDDKKQRLCRIEFDGNNVYVDVYINVKRGCIVADACCKIQENIKRGVDTMTSFNVKEVNVNIVDVVFE